MKAGKKLFFDLTLLELSYLPLEITMHWRWLNRSGDVVKRFKIGLDRGWKISYTTKNIWKFQKKYASEIVELLCYESFWINHTSGDVIISFCGIVDRLVYTGLIEPLKYIDWSSFIKDCFDVKRYKPWAMNIAKYPLPYNICKMLAPRVVKDWVKENQAVEVYKADSLPRVCLISGNSEAIAYYGDFLNSSWIFHIEYTSLYRTSDQFFKQYISFLIKHNALYMFIFGRENSSLTQSMKKLMGIKKYTHSDLEREKQADPKRYELWKKHFGEILMREL